MTDKRQLLIDTALSLFTERGINLVGINEVLKVSGVAKKTLYHHFSSKEALIVAVLETRHQIFIHWLEERLAQAQDDLSLIDALFSALDDWFNDRVPQLSQFHGCLFINSAIECGDCRCQVSRFAKFHKQAVRELIEQRLSQPNESLVDLICLMKEGAIVSAMVSQDKAAALRSQALLKRLAPSLI
ncbi:MULTISPECIES: TetR/AcrR family transcriptional regulator [Shewanella]|uniref:TetR/AcrR family transcriptional regulator n=1 Tax=Shewanella TaxID=22 RepID=UPI001EFE1645|nr:MULTISPECIES: TetR/AcrR family transcriptional regulator [Shewanella]MCG9746199.1 TetR/AcrR family transcriptional regulator [Shewanella sp. Isolate8]MCL2910301.1 TetR/AcrR family transcriptional regulator [Shewanella aquimarina]